MDAFVVRKRRSPRAALFESDAFLLVPAVSGGSDSNGALRELLAANGGRVLAATDAVDAILSSSGATTTRVVVVLQHEQVDELSAQDTEMLARVLRCRNAASAGTAALVVRAQWVHDCATQQARLATHAYDLTRAVLALSKRVDGSGISSTRRASTDTLEHGAVEGNKRRKVESATAPPSSSAAAVVSLVSSAADVAAVAVLDALPRPHLTPWRDVGTGSLLILDARSAEQQQRTAAATLQDPAARVKIAGFDMDGTWIETKSGKRFAKDAHDWKWLHPTHVRTKLEALVRAGFHLVLFSNQNGIAQGNVSAKEIQSKVEAIVQKLNLPVLVLLATKSDAMRKPRLGGWREMLAVLGVGADHVDMAASFYCGDAAGRPKVQGRAKDFAATDYKFAVNLGLQFYTPEALFLQSTQRIHTHADMWDIGFDPRTLGASTTTTGLLTQPTTELANPTREIVVLVGSPASGKSFFARTHFASYAIVSQDELKTVANCKKRALEALTQNKSVVVDATNRDARVRAEWVTLAKQQCVPIRCFEMDVPKPLSMHLNTFRSLTEDKKIPDIAIHSFYKSFVAPQAAEGFAEVVKVRFQLAPEFAAAKRELLCSFL